MEHRYKVMHGDKFHCGTRYCVYDSQERKLVFKAFTKPEAIAKAQELNGFSPVDGSEQTYAHQVEGNMPF